eukprot:744083-Pleurochrysis_carterae.AAC.1
MCIRDSITASLPRGRVHHRLSPSRACTLPPFFLEGVYITASLPRGRVHDRLSPSRACTAPPLSLEG